MKNIINVNFIGDGILNIFVNGTFYKKNFGTLDAAKENYHKIVDAKQRGTDEAVQEVMEIIDKRILIGKVAGMVYDPVSGDVYYKNFSTPMPDLLVEKIETYVEEGFPVESLINFWKLLMGNPDKTVRKDLFKYLMTHDFSITDKGYFIAYKSVAYKQAKENDLAEFVSNSYLKVKRWKKSPKNFLVVSDLETEELSFVDTKKKEPNYEEVELVGNLDDLFKNIDEIMDEDSVVYTDHYSSSMDIILGTPVTMERCSADANPSIECSTGLHVGATQYVNTFGGSDSPILTCFVNPMNVVAVPQYDNTKIRVCEYYPFALNDRDENKKIVAVEQPYFEDDYCNYEVKELEKLLQKISKDEGLRELTAENGEKDIRDVEEIKNIIEARLVSINDTFN